MMLVIPGTLPGLNDMIDAARTSKYTSARQKKDNTELVAWCAKKAKIPTLAKIGLIITWYEPNMKRDPDNVQAGVKYIWDGLVVAGALINDGWKQQGPVQHIMAVDRDRPRVEIEITEVE